MIYNSQIIFTALKIQREQLWKLIMIANKYNLYKSKTERYLDLVRGNI